MNVVIVCDYVVSGGGATQVALSSATGLAALGHKVTYISGVADSGRSGLDDQSGVRCISLEGRDVWSKNRIAGARDGVWNRHHMKRLASVLAEFPPDDTVVHAHQWTRFFSPSLFAVIRDSGLPLAISLHDYFLSCPNGLMYLPRSAEPCARRPLSSSCLMASCDPRGPLHKAVRVMRTMATNHALRKAPFTAIHVSEAGRRVIGSYLPPQARQVVIENPVECKDRGPRDGEGAGKVVYCGRLTMEKGVDIVAQAARLAGAPSLFIGDGPMRDAILAIDPQAEITGWLDKDAVRERIAREALAVVAPSRWPETGPLVVPEAMALGVPAVVSERAGAAFRVRDGENGFVVAPEAEAVAAALKALSQPRVAARLGENAYRDYWAAPPSREAHAAQLVDVYRRAIQEMAARRADAG